MKKTKIRDLVKGTLFIAGFFFVGSGMLEAVVLRLLEVMGL